MGINEDITSLKNIARIGTISSIDTSNRTARVKFSDKNDLVSAPLRVLKNPPLANIENTTDKIIISPWLPAVGDMVLCIYIPNGESDGFIIGGL